VSSFLSKIVRLLELGLVRADPFSKLLTYTGLASIIVAAAGFNYTLQPTPKETKQQIDLAEYLRQIKVTSTDLGKSGSVIPSTAQCDSVIQKLPRPSGPHISAQVQLVAATVRDSPSKMDDSVPIRLGVSYRNLDLQPSGPCVLNFNVYDADGLRPLPGIRVTLIAPSRPDIRKESKVTNNEGEVQFSNLPCVRYMISAGSRDYATGHSAVPLNKTGSVGHGTTAYMNLKRISPRIPSPTPTLTPTLTVTPRPGINGQLLINWPKELARGWTDSFQVVYKPPEQGTPPDLVEGFTTFAAFRLIKPDGLEESEYQTAFKPLYQSEEDWRIPIEPSDQSTGDVQAELLMLVQLVNRLTGEIKTPSVAEAYRNLDGPTVTNRRLTEKQSHAGWAIFGIGGVSLVFFGMGRGISRGTLDNYNPQVVHAGGVSSGDRRVMLEEKGGGNESKSKGLDTDEREEDSPDLDTATSGARAQGDGERDRASSSPVPLYKRINAWITERENEPEKPLNLCETYTLNLGVGEPFASSLITTEDANISVSDIPDEGLNTEWVIISNNVELESIAGDSSVSVQYDGRRMTWEARFSLHIPKTGESEIRQLRVTPELFFAELRIIIFASGRPYRQFKVRLKVISSDMIDGEKTSAAITGELIHIPGKYAALQPPHEWQTPDGVINITVFGAGQAYANGITPEGPLATIFAWKGAIALLDPIIRNLRGRTEKFRAAFSDEINDISPSDLENRLRILKKSHSSFWESDRADDAHRRVWDEKIAKSTELYEMAYYGYQLYQTLFPHNSLVRKALDSLTPGWRLNISWFAQTDSAWLPNVPWGFLYREPPVSGKAIDPLNFWGLRFRLNYLAYQIENLQAPTFGSLSETVKGYGMYWGKQESEIADEVTWQQKQWAQWANQRFVPDNSINRTHKEQVLDLLNTPSQNPMPVLYLFCQCDVDDGSKPVLRFGNTKDPADNIKHTELSQDRFKDQSLVFVNACTSVGSDPYIANQLEQSFFTRGCRAYLGTEIKVPIRLASRFASIFYHLFYREVDPCPMAAGEAVYQARRFLWREYKNIGGLFYTYVNQYELYMATDEELRAPHP
jgi:hypothetical protein